VGSVLTNGLLSALPSRLGRFLWVSWLFGTSRIRPRRDCGRSSVSSSPLLFLVSPLRRSSEPW
jgi:hypothetical protein